MNVKEIISNIVLSILENRPTDIEQHILSFLSKSQKKPQDKCEPFKPLNTNESLESFPSSKTNKKLEAFPSSKADNCFETFPSSMANNKLDAFPSSKNNNLETFPSSKADNSFEAFPSSKNNNLEQFEKDLKKSRGEFCNKLSEEMTQLKTKFDKLEERKIELMNMPFLINQNYLSVSSFEEV